jgi:hypothetical protein
MKLLVSALILTSASATTCEDTTKCVTAAVNEKSSDEFNCYNQGTPCEYEVCFSHKAMTGNGWCEQTVILDKNGNPSDYTLNGFDKYGDMVGAKGGDQSLCPNEANNAGKGYWDETCADGDELTGAKMFKGVCQNIAAGHTAYFLVHEETGMSCSEGDPVDFSVTPTTCGNSCPDDLISAGHCAPSTSNPDLHDFGQTYFPASKPGTTGGTCSDSPEGHECVFAVTVPKYCKYQEPDYGGKYPCEGTVNYNDDTVCDTRESVLDYYENPHNAAPPVIPIHDITQNNDGTVTFGVINPYSSADEKDIHDIYTIYHDAANGNEQCEKEVSAAYCPHTQRITAKCMDDDQWTVVTVFAVGFDDESGSAKQVESGDKVGAHLYKCCPTSISANAKRKYTAAWTYLIHCDCPPDESSRGLRVRDDLAEKFQKGELFDDELKQIYGLN